MDAAARSARLGLIGGECTGKSTLAAALSRELDGCLVPEYLREFVTTRGRTPHRDEQAVVMRVQQEREDQAARTCATGLVVADPAALMTAVYSVVYFADDTLVAPAATLAAGYDLIVWCGTDLPWTPDGPQRDGPEFRAREDEVIGSIVADVLQPSGVAVVRADGPPEARLATVLRAWQPGPPVTPT